MTYSALPVSQVAGRRIGLFGGSFNPAHEGHVSVSAEAIKRLALDQVWWMVSPQNPLKDHDETKDFEHRLNVARGLNSDPRMVVTGIERTLGTRTTAATFRKLAPLFRQGHFVWIMGADSLAGLHEWHDWQVVATTLPLAVFARPGWSRRALASPAARLLASHRIDVSDAMLLPRMAPPAWCFIQIALNWESSTRLRNLDKLG